MKRLLPVLLLGLLALSCAAEERSKAPSGDLILSWTIDGVTRDGMLHIPTSALTKPAPVVFVWHGHGGSMRNAVNMFGFHKLWPEAVSVYMQGLPTPGRLTDPEGRKAGWQSSAGDQGDRDLKLFDAVLAQLRRDYKIDDRRIYTTGHSNGGGFSYLLWSTRGDVFAAVAPSAAAALRPRETLPPKPVLHVAGENDPLVKFEWQKLTLDRVRSINGCGESRPWGGSPLCQEYVSASGTPVVACIHPGGHEFLKGSPALIMKFFQEHSKPAASPKAR